MTAALFDFGQFPQLDTKRLTLRELSPDDASDVFVYRSDSAVQIFNAKTQESVAEASELISDLRALYDQKQEVVWAMVLRDSGRVIGDVSIHAWARYHRYADLWL